MQLSEALFQEKIWEEIRSSVAEKRWPQSSMLIGEAGYAGLVLAMGVAKLHFCSNSKDGHYCDTCKDCTRVNTLSHPNLSFLIPTIGKQLVGELIQDWKKMILENPFADAVDWMEQLNSGGSKPNISSQNTRSFIRELNTSGLESKGKIAIIWQADYLGKEGNILLKSIEEPPRNTKIIILANRKENILSTILSRSQNFYLRPIPDSAMLEAFKKLNAPSQAKHEEIARLSGGSMKEAYRLLNMELDEVGEFFVSFLRYSFKGNPLEIKELIESGIKQGKNVLRNSLEFGLKFIKEMLYYVYLEGQYDIKLRTDLKLSAEKLSSILDLSKLDELSKEIDQTILGIDRNANIKILLFNAALNIHYLLKRNI